MQAVLPRESRVSSCRRDAFTGEDPCPLHEGGARPAFRQQAGGPEVPVSAARQRPSARADRVPWDTWAAHGGTYLQLLQPGPLPGCVGRAATRSPVLTRARGQLSALPSPS